MQLEQVQNARVTLCNRLKAREGTSGVRTAVAGGPGTAAGPSAPVGRAGGPSSGAPGTAMAGVSAPSNRLRLAHDRTRRARRHVFTTFLLSALLLAGGGLLPARQARAADFRVNIEFHINTQRRTFDQVVTWLKSNITTAEALYGNAPRLVIHPTFVQENHPRIKSRVDASGRPFSYIGFDNASELQKFMDENFDNQARSRTDGHLTALVVDDVVKNEKKDKALCGRSSFPHWVTPFNRKLGLLLATCTEFVDVAGNSVPETYLLAHEIGHFFSLKHTFEPYINLNPFVVANCNKDFGNLVKCNSCQNGPHPDSSGDLRLCGGISNVMDYCGSEVGKETLNACQLDRAARQRARYQTSDGQTDYQAMAGSRGGGACESDAFCEADEWCTTGILNLARNICKVKQDRGSACTSHRQCASDRCSWGICAEPDECRADDDCSSGQYCGDPVLGKRTCKAKAANDEACALAGGDKQCLSGHCKMGRCYGPHTAAAGDACFVNEACTGGKCSSINGTRGTCVCDADGDCDAGFWCNQGLDFTKNQCQHKLDKGEVCGTLGELGVGHRCKSGDCKATLGTKLTCR